MYSGEPSHWQQQELDQEHPMVSMNSSSFSSSSSSSSSQKEFESPPPIYNSDESDSDEEVMTLAISSHSNAQPTQNKREYTWRNRVGGHQQLVRDYFTNKSVYFERLFRKRFRMYRPLFLRIIEEVTTYDPFFIQKMDAAGRMSFSPLQKVTAAMRILVGGFSYDVVDEYLRMSESTASMCLKHFTRAIVALHREEYLRAPNSEDIGRLLADNASRGFPGMLGSIDCMHWVWKNCPTALTGQYKSGRNKNPTIILEAVADKDLWIWHAFFGMPGAFNDINVLDQSPIFDVKLHGRSPPCNFSVNVHNYNTGYYLADGIYPNYACFVKTIPHPVNAKHRHFAMMQEAMRKDVERAFGVLQARWKIIREPGRQWSPIELGFIMKTYIILNNMITEDEGRPTCPDLNYEGAEPNSPVYRNRQEEMQAFINRGVQLRDYSTHSQLRDDLIENLWRIRGNA